MTDASCEGGHWGDSFSALENPYRRQLLVGLLTHSQEEDDVDPLVLLADGGDTENVAATIHHVHLPKLDDMGFIEWNQQAEEICRGPMWDKIEPLLELIHDHRDELPDGWLDAHSG